MRQLSRLEGLLFMVGGILMVVGVGLNFFGFSQTGSWLFLLGSALFAAMQLRQRYKGTNFVIRRLRRIMTVADVLFILSGLLLVENSNHFLLPLFSLYGMDGVIAYNQYVVHNNWVVTLLIAAVLELYTIHRISNELEQEAKKM